MFEPFVHRRGFDEDPDGAPGPYRNQHLAYTDAEKFDAMLIQAHPVVVRGCVPILQPHHQLYVLGIEDGTHPEQV